MRAWELVTPSTVSAPVTPVVTRHEGRRGVTPASHRARHSPTNAYKDSRGQNVDTSCQPDTKHAADGARTNERDRRICLSFLSPSFLLPVLPALADVRVARVAPRVPILISTAGPLLIIMPAEAVRRGARLLHFSFARRTSVALIRSDRPPY